LATRTPHAGHPIANDAVMLMQVPNLQPNFCEHNTNESLTYEFCATLAIVTLFADHTPNLGLSYVSVDFFSTNFIFLELNKFGSISTLI
jgi:hypothetical protein